MGAETELVMSTPLSTSFSSSPTLNINNNPAVPDGLPPNNILTAFADFNTAFRKQLLLHQFYISSSDGKICVLYFCAPAAVKILFFDNRIMVKL